MIAIFPETPPAPLAKCPVLREFALPLPLGSLFSTPKGR